jgi:hypothetical protein
LKIIKQLFRGLQEMVEGEDELNPIMRVPVMVTGDEGTAYMDIMPCEEGDEQQEQGIQR